MNIDEVIAKMPMKEDCVFIRSQLSRFPEKSKHNIFKGYLDEWRIGKEKEPVIYKKENAGRYRANIWIQEQED